MPYQNAIFKNLSPLQIHPDVSQTCFYIEEASISNNGEKKSHVHSEDEYLDSKDTLKVVIICLAVVAGVLIFINIGLRSFSLRFCAKETVAVQV
jgi:hypothetical protein